MKKKDEITEDVLLKLGFAYDPKDPTRMIKREDMQILDVPSGTPPELPPHTPEELDALTRLVACLGPLSAVVIARLLDGSDFVVQGRGLQEAAKRASRGNDVIVITIFGLSETGAKWLRFILEVSGRNKSSLPEHRQAIIRAFPTLSSRELEQIFGTDHCTWWREKRKVRGVSSETPPALLTTSFARAPQAGKVLDGLQGTARTLPPGTHTPRRVRSEAWQEAWRNKNNGPLLKLEVDTQFHHCRYEKLEKIVGDLTGRANCLTLDGPWGASCEDRRRIAEMSGRTIRPGGVLAIYVGEHWDYEWETELRLVGFHKLGSVTMLNGVTVRDKQVKLLNQEDQRVSLLVRQSQRVG